MALSAGTRIGPYEVSAPLGAGGMGEVYRATDTRLKREAALKCLPARLANDAMALERFRREAQLLAGLSHPNIAAVYGLEMGADGAAVLAMELVPGATLAERLHRGPMPPEEAVAVALQIAEALEYAHERGIIHRDLKPANIKLTPDDQVKVLDFGLAKALTPELAASGVSDDSPTLTSPATLAGTLLGTAAYMSPEQARAKAVDRRADIWAFGAVLYEMLTGRRAFPGDNATDVIAAVIRAEPDWSLVPEATPPALRQLTERCLRKDLRQRLQWMGDARLALEDMARGGAAAENVLPAPAPRWPWLAGIGVAGLIVGALAFWSLASHTPRPAPATYQAVTNFSGEQMQPALSPDGRSVAFASNRDGSFNIYSTVVGGGGLIQLTHGTAVKAHPAWSPDGAEIAYAQLNASGLWDVWEVAALGGTPRLVLPDAADPAWSPDGQWLAYDRPSTGALWISRPSGEGARELAPNVEDHDGEPGFSPDGKQIVFVAKAPGPYGQIEKVNVAGGGLRALTTEIGSPDTPAWSPGGRSVYFACGCSGTINVWKVGANGGALTQVTSGAGDDAELDLSANGKRMVFATFRTDLRIAQLALGAATASSLRVLSTDPARNELQAVYSPDGKRLAFFTNLKGVQREQIWTSDADGTNATPLVTDGNGDLFPRWSPNGRRVIFISELRSNGASLFRSVPAGGGAAETITTAPNPSIFDFSVSAAGQLLFPGLPRQIDDYDPATYALRTLATLPTALTPALIRWMPDGKQIAFSVNAHSEGDANQGVWVDDLQHPPRQIFHGWVLDFECGPQGKLYILAGSPDLHATLWTWTPGLKAPVPLPVTVPMSYDYWGIAAPSRISIAPDGRHMVFGYDDDAQANIGMLTF